MSNSLLGRGKAFSVNSEGWGERTGKKNRERLNQKKKVGADIAGKGIKKGIKSKMYERKNKRKRNKKLEQGKR